MSTRALTLYRAILKEHRNRLPSHMRMLGDDYVRNEFKQHKTAKPEQLKMFFTAWDNYLTLMRKQEGTFGRDLDEGTKSALNDEQRKKLNDLKNEAGSADIF
jgi:hypothetical protein